MLEPLTGDEARRRLVSGGFAEEGAFEWVADYQQLSKDPAGLEADARKLGSLTARGWKNLDEMPRRSQRTEAEKGAGNAIVRLMADASHGFARRHRDALYSSLTGDGSRLVRVDDLVYQAAERWPGLVPERKEIAREAAFRQADKDGREILQGVFLSQVLASPDAGRHLCHSMLQPTEEALGTLDKLIMEGVVDLGGARVEVHGEAGHITLSSPRYLNAEDDETVRAQEAAVDLVLLHPGIRMGILRGDYVEHPKYRNRRIFSSGINLTKLYHGKISYLFYLIRDLGMVHKLFRGLAQPELLPGGPEATLEKPWLAAVDAFAIGGGCQLLLVVDYVIAESGAYFNLPARKEGIIPGAANLRLPRFLGERLARQAILFDKTFYVESAEARSLVNEVHPRSELDGVVERFVSNAVGSGLVSASGNRKALRVGAESLDIFREYMSTYALEQAFCHVSEQLTENLEKFWQAADRRL